MKWVTLVWADKFRELVKQNDRNSKQVVMEFLVYVQEKEADLNLALTEAYEETKDEVDKDGRKIYL